MMTLKRRTRLHVTHLHAESDAHSVTRIYSDRRQYGLMIYCFFFFPPKTTIEPLVGEFRVTVWYDHDDLIIFINEFPSRLMLSSWSVPFWSVSSYRHWKPTHLTLSTLFLFVVPEWGCVIWGTFSTLWPPIFQSSATMLMSFLFFQSWSVSNRQDG